MTEMIKNFKILSLYDDVLTQASVARVAKNTQIYADVINNTTSNSPREVVKSVCKIAWLMIACFPQQDKEKIINTADMMGRCKDARAVAISELITSYNKFLKSIDKKDLSTAKRNATRFLYLASVFCGRNARTFSKEMMSALER